MRGTVNEENLKKFTHNASEWWNPTGVFKPLHDLNPTRIKFIKQELLRHCKREDHLKGSLGSLSIVDVGCGGGLVCEPLARLGASVTGLDAGHENITAAIEHANGTELSIDYRALTTHDFLTSYPQKKFDVVLALEIVEHVENLPDFIQSCVSLLKPNGIIIFSTLNRTIKSFLLGIVAAEYILRWVPRGTHSWQKFLKPSELALLVEDCGGIITTIQGMVYNPLKNSWNLSDDLDINYFMTALFNDN